MIVAAEWGVGEVLWSMFWFFLFVLWIWLVIIVFADILRSDLSGLGKMAWTIAIIFLPYLGVFLYLLVHGDGMRHRIDGSHTTYEESVQNYQNYLRSVGGSTKSASDELADLASLHNAGVITDREYEQAKAKVTA